MAERTQPAFLGDESTAPTIAPSSSSISNFDNDEEPADFLSDPKPKAAPTKEKHEQQTSSSPKEEDQTSGLKDGDDEKPKRASLDGSAKAASMHKTKTREDGTLYPTGLKLVSITIALCLSVFLIALDNAIITTAIPKITDQFQSLNDVGWYGSAYLLTTAALQLLFGKFYSYFSIKWVYLIAIGLFELGSLICGVANSSMTLIIGRAIAGLGSAGVFSGALIILAHSVPMARRPMYTGFIGSMYGIASVAGPLLGGVFTDRVTWRWCFYINLPIGAITIFVIILWFRDPDRSAEMAQRGHETWQQKVVQFDPVGTVLFMPAIICLLLALQWGGTTYPWRDGRIIALFVVFGVLIIAWLYVQRRQGDLATVPPRIIKKRTVWSGTWYAFCTGSAFFIAAYFVPIWFQAVKGVSAVQSGIMNLPMLLGVVVMSLIAGGLVTYWGYYAPFMLLGTIFMAVGFGLISTWVPETGSPVWIGYQVLAGAGVGLGMQQPLMAVQTVLDIADVPIGTSVVIFMQTLGGALFVSISQNVFTNKLVEYVSASVPGLDPSVVLGAGATAISSMLSPELIPLVVRAYSDALTKTFLVSASMASIGIIGSAFIEWKSVKGKNVEMAMA